jgi:hypothetical protein
MRAREFFFEQQASLPGTNEKTGMSPIVVTLHQNQHSFASIPLPGEEARQVADHLRGLSRTVEFDEVIRILNQQPAT